MKALSMHLRFSPLRWLVVPLVLLDMAILLLRTTDWIGIWPETGAAGQIPAFFLSMIAAGVAAWASGSTARNRLDEQLAAAAIPRPRSEAYRLGTCLLVLLVPYAIGQATAFVLTARSFPPGAYLWFGYSVMGVTVMFLGTAWGWFLGRYLGSVYAALVAVLSWIVFMFYASQKADLSVTSGPPWTEVDLRTTGVRLVVALLLCVGILWLPARRTDRGPKPGGFAIPAVAALVAVATIGGTSVLSDRAAPAHPLCVNGNITMCLWPEHELYLPMVRALDARVASLPDDFRLPDRLVEFGMDRVTFSDDGETFTQLEGDFDISEGSRWSLALGMADSILRTTLQGCDRPAMIRDKERSSEAVSRWLEGYLAGEGTRDYTTSGVPADTEEAWDMAATATGRSLGEQFAWVGQQLRPLKERYCA